MIPRGKGLLLSLSARETEYWGPSTDSCRNIIRFLEIVSCIVSNLAAHDFIELYLWSLIHELHPIPSNSSLTVLGGPLFDPGMGFGIF